jgi:hypothetical protein
MALATVALAGCGGTSVSESARPSISAASPAPTSSAVDPWTGEPIDTVATGDPPAFPQQLTHWMLVGQWSDLPRAFAGDGTWTVTVGPNASPFPATMNGCNDGRFLVRWRAVDDGVDVLAGEARIDGQGNLDGSPWKQVNAHSGWMDIDQCYAPVFRMAGALADGTNLADVTVQVQEYQPAP